MIRDCADLVDAVGAAQWLGVWLDPFDVALLALRVVSRAACRCQYA